MTANTEHIQVQQQDFSIAQESERLLSADGNSGALAMFVGLVRDLPKGGLQSLYLEHYPGMTEKVLNDIVRQAKQRWPVNRVSVIHRVGELALAEQIVFVGATAKHREDAFAVCQFIMDFIKNDAPFWKKEQTAEGEYWVSFNSKDQQAKLRWENEA